jgi:integrase/recombinase XerD
MLNTKILLDTRRIMKDGTYPIIFIIYYHGKTSTRSTKIYVAERQCDDKKRLIRNVHPQSVSLNKWLLKDFVSYNRD